jgi:dihydrodipicolinate synthase/N-acetylneuraminate lyase
VIYNSPYYGFATRADLFFELRREYPNLIGFKEFGGGADLRYAAEHITSQDDDVTLMVGVDTQWCTASSTATPPAPSPASATPCRAKCCNW